MLPSKTIPEVKNRKCHALKPKTKMTAAAPPRKKARIMSGTEVEVIEDEDSPHTGRSTSISPASSFQMSYHVPVKVRIVSLIHSLFQ
jgi:hypothetical protein